MNRLYKRSEVDMISCHMLTHVCLGDEVDDSCYPRYDFFCLKNCIRIVYVGLTEMICSVSATKEADMLSYLVIDVVTNFFHPTDFEINLPLTMDLIEYDCKFNKISIRF